MKARTKHTNTHMHALLKHLPPSYSRDGEKGDESITDKSNFRAFDTLRAVIKSFICKFHLDHRMSENQLAQPFFLSLASVLLCFIRKVLILFDMCFTKRLLFILIDNFILFYFILCFFVS